MKTLKIFLLAVLVILLCIFLPSGMPQMDTGMGRNVAVTGESLQNIIKIRIEKMRSLGISEADDRIGEAAAEAYGAYLPEVAEVLEEMSAGMPQVDGLIFYYIGAGEYDYDKWEWTPSSRQVYAFDMEVFNVSSMYTDFLHGVLALTGMMSWLRILRRIAAGWMRNWGLAYRPCVSCVMEIRMSFRQRRTMTGWIWK